MLEGYRTIIAAVVALIGATAQKYIGLDIGDQAEIVTSVMVFGGTIGAIVFRVLAKKNLRESK